MSSDADQQASELPARFGKYLLVDRIAYGGMAEIFRAKSYGVSGFEKTIVIKRILPSYSEDQEFVDMLIDEAKLCASLQHANIVQIFDLGRLEGRYYIAMEYVNGVDLVQVLSRLRKAKTRLPLELACFIMSEALMGLDYAHRATDPDGNPLHIIHRDFNPANILLSLQGEVKVADFGIAKASDRGSKTMRGGLKGKMGYLSPEQVEAEAELDARSDVFTAGITFWEMLATRRMFFSGSDLDILIAIRDAAIPDIRDYFPEIPTALEHILQTALTKDVNQRFATAGEFKEAIDDFLFDHGIKISPSHLEGYLKHLFADKIEQNRRQSQTQKPVMATRQQPPKYWLRQPGQQPRGPLAFGELADMISAGQVTRRAQVLREGGHWREIMQVPELAPQLSKLPTAEESDPESTPTYQGHLVEVSYPKLYYRLAIAKENGRLVLGKPDVKKEVYLRRGLPEFVKSDMINERLGEYLVSKKVITKQQRDEGVKAMKGYSGRLGDTLIGLGILQPHELFEKLTEQVREKILEVFSWNSGTYSFYANQNYSGEVIPLKVGSFELVAEGVRGYADFDMLKNRFRARMDSVIRKEDNPYLSVEKLGLLAREQRVMDLIDGSLSIRDLLVRGGANKGNFEQTVYRVLYILEELEMISFR